MQSTPASRPLNVMLIDDDPSMVRLLKAVISKHFAGRFQITTHTDPNDAKKWLDDNCCDIVISDIEMPGIDGLELLAFAKKRNAWTQVLFVTGQSTWDRLTEAIENGATDYLLKPIVHEELLLILEQLYIRCVRWQAAALRTLQSTSR